MSWPIAPVPCQPCRSMSCSKNGGYLEARRGQNVPNSRERTSFGRSLHPASKPPGCGSSVLHRSNLYVKKLLLVRNHKIKLMKILAFIIFSISPPLRGFPTSGGARFICENEGGAATAVKVFQRFPTKKTGVFLVDVFSTPLKWTIKQ